MHKSIEFGLVLLVMLTSCSVTKQFSIIDSYKSSDGKTYVFGKIIDHTGRPMPAAIIQGVNRRNKVHADKDGKYSLEITDGSNKIRALWIGYLTYQTKGIKLHVGDSIHVDITLIESKEALVD